MVSNGTIRTALQAASNGNFMMQSITRSYKLIENLAASSSNKSPEYKRSGKVNSIKEQKLDELNSKLNLLMKADLRGIFQVDDGSEAIQNQEETVNTEQPQEINYIDEQGYVQNRGFNPNYRDHPNLSYWNTNEENPQDQIYPNQGVQNQQYQSRSFGHNPNFKGKTSPSSPDLLVRTRTYKDTTTNGSTTNRRRQSIHSVSLSR